MDNEASPSLPTWDAEKWLDEFHGFGHYHTIRKRVWENTLAAVRAGGYTLPDGTEVKLLLSSDPTTMSFFYSKPFTADFTPLPGSALVTVGPEDCLDAAKALREQGHEVAVLNLANAYTPGGGVRGGAGAQEEYLFRCSDYFRSLYRYAPDAKKFGLTPSHSKYPMDPDFGGVYSPRITVFRGNEASGYPLLKKPWTVNMIAVAGIDTPDTTCDPYGEIIMAQYEAERTKNKIRTILRIAADNGQRYLILGALGCGAFDNPPRHVARLFRETLSEPEFKGAFARVHFAIKSDHNSRGTTNFTAFHAELDGLEL